jgi:hypothetical protein
VAGRAVAGRAVCRDRSELDQDQSAAKKAGGIDGQPLEIMGGTTAGGALPLPIPTHAETPNDTNSATAATTSFFINTTPTAQASRLRDSQLTDCVLGYESET